MNLVPPLNEFEQVQGFQEPVWTQDSEGNEVQFDIGTLNALLNGK